MKIKRSGIRIRGRKENFHIARVQAYETVDAIGPCDLVMIALKATNNEALLQLIPLYCIRAQSCSPCKMG